MDSMKKLIFLLLALALFVFISLRAQEIDSLRVLCKERGHVNSGVCTSTLMYCPPYLEETEYESVMVYPACNIITYTCSRCGQQIKEREKEHRVVIWRRQDEYKHYPNNKARIFF